MDREHMKLSNAHEPVDDTVRLINNFPNRRIFEFRNRPARFREWSKSICGRDEAGDDDRGIVRGVLADERTNRGQVGTRLLCPEHRPHERNCFLTSSWDTS